MAQPLSGLSHTRSSLVVASGLNVNGGQWPLLSVGLQQANGPTAMAAVSGVFNRWGKVVMGRALTIRAIGIGFPQTGPLGSAAHPYAVTILSCPSSGAVVRKGTVTFGIVAAKLHLYKAGLAATIPAGNAMALELTTVGATAAGIKGKPFIHYTTP
jgi:hypothetical protein